MTLAIGYSMPGVLGIIGTVIAFYLWYVSLGGVLSITHADLLTMLQVLPYNSYSLCNGGYERDVAQPAVALG